MSQDPLFSEREKKVIALLVEGKSNKQIALALGISVRTVEFHLGNIYSKLLVSSRGEAIVKLSKSHLWESTGDPQDSGLKESTVEVKDNLSHNERKSSISDWRPPLKTIFYVGAGLLAVFLVVFLSLANPYRNQTVEKHTTISIPTSLPTTPASPLPTSTAWRPLSPREEIVAKARQLVAGYDKAIQAEMKKGQVEVSQDPASGKEIFRFTGDSYTTIAKLYDDLNQQLQPLNEQYLALYIADVQPTPFPTQATEKENEDYYQELIGQYQAFLDQLLRDGPTVRVYDPTDGIYYNRFIGDTYARSEIMWNGIQALHQTPQMAKVDQAAQMDEIHKVTGNPDLQLSFKKIMGLANAPWISAAVYTDEAGNRYWVAIDAGRLAQIEPISSPDVPAAEVKSIDAIRPLAEQFTLTNSPRLANLKSELLYEEGSKGDLYFFTWSYRNKDWSGTDWAMMWPFLQVGVSADGKIVTYMNTLDLYK